MAPAASSPTVTAPGGLRISATSPGPAMPGNGGTPPNSSALPKARCPWWAPSWCRASAGPRLLATCRISSQPEHANDVRRAAGHLAEQYERVGLENAQVIETGGHPVVYADWLKAPNKPTVLLYGHYDVQPVDPLDLWTSPPFEPIRQDGQLLGRGSSDDKGQIALHWQAIQAWLRTTGELPLNLKR